MKYNIAVIGGGPAGYSAALEAVRQGMSAVLFEKDLLGGTCLNRGCVPTKFLIQTAQMHTQIRNSARYGITAKEIQMDFVQTCREKERIVTQLRENLQQLLRQKKISIVKGCAKVTEDKRIFSQGVEYEADAIIIATGSSSARPFAQDAVTTDEILKMNRIPESLQIIGGGVSAAEFAYIFHSLGSNVTIMLRRDRILKGWDRDIAVGLMQNMRKKGIVILTKCSPEELRERKAEIILSATGRIPNLEGLDLSLFELGSSGGIIADVCGRTKTDGIYAAGDVVEGSLRLAHMGMEQGRRTVQCIAGKEPGRVPATVRCIYTEPEIASVGLTEAEAKENGMDTVSVRMNMQANARTMIATQERCFIKLVADRKTHRLIGAQFMCERAGDIAGEAALALNNDLTVEELCRSVRPHPSFCEGITDTAEALMERLR